MLPIGQALWLKELETYIEFPPMQDPASYNLDQVMQQVQEMKTIASSELNAQRGAAGAAAHRQRPTVGSTRLQARGRERK